MRIVVTKKGKVEFSGISSPNHILQLPPINNQPKRAESPMTKLPTPSSNHSIEEPQKPSHIKEIKLKQKKLMIPSSMEERYSKDEEKNYIINEISSTLSDSNLPVYKKEFPLCNILSPININDHQKGKKKINYKKEIRIENANLINYLSENKKINSSFLTKISHSNEEQLFKLNKICQKHLHNEEVESVMKNVIRKKVEWEYVKDSDFYKKGLQRMKRVLNNYHNVYQELQKKEDRFYGNKLQFCMNKHY